MKIDLFRKWDYHSRFPTSQNSAGISVLPAQILRSKRNETIHSQQK